MTNETDSEKRYLLSRKDIERIATIASETGIKCYLRELSKNEYNPDHTKELLRSYRRIKAILSIPDFSRESAEKRLMNSLLIRKIETAFGLYRKECEKSGNPESERRYRETEMYYLTEQPHTVMEISETEQVSEKTVYRDLDLSSKILSEYLKAL